MQDNLKNILSHLSTEIDQETLLKYLQGQLTEEQKHEVEKKMQVSEFHNDAWEGLQDIKDKKNIGTMVEQLNRDLRHKLDKKKKRREKMRIKDQPWLLIAALIILLLIVLSYFIIQKLLQNN